MLLPSSHPGLETGPRHNPVDSGFMNGTVRGTDVFVPLDQVVGGQGRVGFGWNMLMECLGEGRGISLPASAARVRSTSSKHVHTGQLIQLQSATHASTTHSHAHTLTL